MSHKSVLIQHQHPTMSRQLSRRQTSSCPCPAHRLTCPYRLHPSPVRTAPSSVPALPDVSPARGRPPAACLHRLQDLPRPAGPARAQCWSGGPPGTPATVQAPETLPGEGEEVTQVYEDVTCKYIQSLNTCPRVSQENEMRSGWCCLAALSSPLSRLHSPVVSPSQHRAAGAVLSSPLSRLHSPVVSHLTTERLVLSGGPLQSPQSATLPRGVPISPQSGWCCPLQSPQ